MFVIKNVTTAYILDKIYLGIDRKKPEQKPKLSLSRILGFLSISKFFKCEHQ